MKLSMDLYLDNARCTATSRSPTGIIGWDAFFAVIIDRLFRHAALAKVRRLNWMMFHQQDSMGSIRERNFLYNERAARCGARNDS